MEMRNQGKSIICLLGLVLRIFTLAQTAQITVPPDSASVGVVPGPLFSTDDQGNTNFDFEIFLCIDGSMFMILSSFFGCCDSDASKACFATAVVNNSILMDRAGMGTSCDPILETAVTDTIYEKFPTGGKTWHSFECAPATMSGFPGYAPAGDVLYRTVVGMPPEPPDPAAHGSGAGSSLSRAWVACFVTGTLAAIMVVEVLAML